MIDSSSSSPQILASLLDRYLAGEATPGEIAQVETWIAAHPAGKAVLETLRGSHDAGRAAVLRATVEERWSALAQRMHAAPSLPPSRSRTPSRSIPYRAIVGSVGAALVILLAFVGHNIRHARSAAPPATTPGTIYTTQPGQLARIELRDGTQVSLDVSSTLEIPRDFGTTNRTVRLIGAAAFHTIHRTTVPFIVDAAGTRTTVLGTDFAVRDYDAQVRVAVRSGKVSVTPCEVATAGDGCRGNHSNMESAVLTDNELVMVTPSGQMQWRHDPQAIANAFAFTAGQLVLTGAPLKAVVPELDRWYDVDIQLADSTVANLALGGWFPIGTPEDLVDGLEGALGVKVRREGRIIRVEARQHCTPAGTHRCPADSNSLEKK